MGGVSPPDEPDGPAWSGRGASSPPTAVPLRPCLVWLRGVLGVGGLRPFLVGWLGGLVLLLGWPVGLAGCLLRRLVCLWLVGWTGGLAVAHAATLVWMVTRRCPTTARPGCPWC